MGNRGNIILRYEQGGKIYLYTHWAGSEIKDILVNALRRGKDRWDDEAYLARIIFSEMIKDEIMDETGYGIAPYMGDGDDQVLEVNLGEQTVDGVSFKDFI